MPRKRNRKKSQASQLRVKLDQTSPKSKKTVEPGSLQVAHQTTMQASSGGARNNLDDNENLADKSQPDLGARPVEFKSEVQNAKSLPIDQLLTSIVISAEADKIIAAYLVSCWKCPYNLQKTQRESRYACKPSP